jgi:hypothetical protein
MLCLVIKYCQQRFKIGSYVWYACLLHCNPKSRRIKSVVQEESGLNGSASFSFFKCLRTQRSCQGKHLTAPRNSENGEGENIAPRLLVFHIRRVFSIHHLEVFFYEEGCICVMGQLPAGSPPIHWRKAMMIHKCMVI